MRFSRTLAAGLVVVAAAAAVVVWMRRDANLAAAKHAHPDDAELMSEHCALLELMPDSDYASHVADSDGPMVERRHVGRRRSPRAWRDRPHPPLSHRDL